MPYYGKQFTPRLNRSIDDIDVVEAASNYTAANIQVLAAKHATPAGHVSAAPTSAACITWSIPLQLCG
jgi:hypothetical protein